MWGWPVFQAWLALGTRLVFPTYVGVAQSLPDRYRECGGFPHTRGGEPPLLVLYRPARAEFSPHTVGVNLERMMNGGNYCPHSLYRPYFALEALSGWGQYPHTPLPFRALLGQNKSKSLLKSFEQ